MGHVERGAGRRSDGNWVSAPLVVTERRLATHWRALVAAGVLLGIGFGLCFVSLAAARRTESAFGRVLVEFEAPDAAVALTAPAPSPSGPRPAASGQAEQALREIEGITEVRGYAGFIAAADGVGRIASALLAPTGDRFPIELPRLEAGRLPEADAADEVFVNTLTAERNDLEVGERLHLRLVDLDSADTVGVDVTVVGIGTLPEEAVADETAVLDVAVFSRAFYEAHQQLAAYTSASVDLAAGFDARRDLAAEVGALGYELQSVTSQEQQAVDEALRPLIIVLAALGALIFTVTAVAAAQVAGRRRARWHADDLRLLTLGMTRGQLLAVEFSIAGVAAAVTSAVALATMLAVSPVGPVGPLHDLDPAQASPSTGSWPLEVLPPSSPRARSSPSGTPRPAGRRSDRWTPARPVWRPPRAAPPSSPGSPWRGATRTGATGRGVGSRRRSRRRRRRPCARSS